MNYQEMFQRITKDERYVRNLDWGKPRRGHPEGTVRLHISELEKNLNQLCVNHDDDEYWKLRILIHVHDSFKAGSKSGVAILDPRSHASLARSFLEEYCNNSDLLIMVQYHDEPYALFRQSRQRSLNEGCMRKLISVIKDWRLFLRFQVIDGTTAGKGGEPLDWATAKIARRVGLERAMVADLEKLRSSTHRCQKTGQIRRGGTSFQTRNL